MIPQHLIDVLVKDLEAFVRERKLLLDIYTTLEYQGQPNLKVRALRTTKTDHVRADLFLILLELQHEIEHTMKRLQRDTLIIDSIHVFNKTSYKIRYDFSKKKCPVTTQE